MPPLRLAHGLNLRLQLAEGRALAYPGAGLTAHAGDEQLLLLLQLVPRAALRRSAP